uniref:Tyrosine-protein phosphatase domain-containing protein n=1 Tax=Steinernema glaseri TaxID=37863 RepID=A0A1I7YNW9_9BILA
MFDQRPKNSNMEHHTIAAVTLTVILAVALLAIIVRFLLLRARKCDESEQVDDVESQSQISENELVILQNLFLECEHRAPIDAVAANVPPPDYTEKERTFSQACYSLSSSPPSYVDAYETHKKVSPLRAQVLTPIYDNDEKSDSDSSLS